MRADFGVVKRLSEKNNRATFRHSTDRTSHHPINPLVSAATSCSPRAARCHPERRQPPDKLRDAPDAE